MQHFGCPICGELTCKSEMVFPEEYRDHRPMCPDCYCDYIKDQEQKNGEWLDNIGENTDG